MSTRHNFLFLFQLFSCRFICALSHCLVVFLDLFQHRIMKCFPVSWHNLKFIVPLTIARLPGAEVLEYPQTIAPFCLIYLQPMSQTCYGISKWSFWKLKMCSSIGFLWGCPSINNIPLCNPPTPFPPFVENLIASSFWKGYWYRE